MRNYIKVCGQEVATGKRFVQLFFFTGEAASADAGRALGDARHFANSVRASTRLSVWRRVDSWRIREIGEPCKG